MKPRYLIAIILLLAATAYPQSISKIRDRWNAQACVAVGLQKSCLAAEFAAVPAEKRNGAVYYSSDSAFRDGELLPKILAEREERSLQAGAEAINRAFLAASPAERVAACTALKMPDPEVCR